jgi:hypothetical protein
MHGMSVLAIFLGLCLLAIVGEILSQLTYRRKSLGAVRDDLPYMLIRTFVLVTGLMVASFVWSRMGWQPQ